MVENSTGKHLAGKSFDDVVGFEADNMTVEYFPKGEYCLDLFVKTENLGIYFFSLA